jgi:hypothetical protein
MRQKKTDFSLAGFQILRVICREVSAERLAAINNLNSAVFHLAGLHPERPAAIFIWTNALFKLTSFAYLIQTPGGRKFEKKTGNSHLLWQSVQGKQVDLPANRAHNAAPPVPAFDLKFRFGRYPPQDCAVCPVIP